MNVVDDISMHSGNVSHIVENPDDHVGPIKDTPKRLFYIYAPIIHWHVVPSTIENELAWWAIERLVDEAYCFGRQTKEHERLFLEGQKEVEVFMLTKKQDYVHALQEVQVR